MLKSFEEFYNEEADNSELDEVAESDADDDLLEDDDLDNEVDDLEEEDEDIDNDDLSDEIPPLEGEYDAKAKQLWERQWKGVRKREKQIAAKQAVIDKYDGQDQRFDSLASLEEALLDRTKISSVLPELVSHLAKHHGTTVEQLLGTKPSESPASQDDEEIFDEDKRLLEIAEKRLMEKLAPRLAKLDALEAAEQSRGQSSQFDRFVEEHSRPTRLRLKKELGIEFTKAQFVEAIRANPELAKDPIKAMKVHHLTLIEKELSKRTARHAPRGPELTKQSERLARSPKKPREMSFYDFLEEVA